MARETLPTGSSDGQIDVLFSTMRRWPDFEAPELVAGDAADRLLLATARERLSSGAKVCVIGDNYGALALGLLAAGAPEPVRVHQDARSGELALRNNATLATKADAVTLGPTSIQQMPLDAQLVADATLVVVRLPKSLDQLDEWASLIAAHAHGDVVVLAGGRDKYMSPSMTAILERYFGEVTVGRGVQKSRVLSARTPNQVAATTALSGWPRRQHHADVDIHICAFGGVFASNALDIGTRASLDVPDRVPGKQNQRIIDFGCGTGVLAVQLARLRPTAHVVATDQSEAATRSATATVAANNVSDRVHVVREDGLTGHTDNSADLIVFNPPFHSGAAVHADTSLRLFAEAGRVLKPGGELWVVANRHLSYRAALWRLVGATRTVSKTPKFTVTASVKDGGKAHEFKKARNWS